MGNPPLPDGLRRVVRGVGPGGGIRIFDCPVKLRRSVGESPEFRDRRGVSSTSFVELLLARRWSGRWVLPGVLKTTELRSCLEGDQVSVLCGLEGELRRLENVVMSGGMAEMLLRSPTVSSKPVLSPRSKVMSASSKVSRFDSLCTSIGSGGVVDVASFCMSPMALVRPSLMRTVPPSAGEPGGELAMSASSCNLYLTGENAFLGLESWLRGGDDGRVVSSCRGGGASMVSTIFSGEEGLLSTEIGAGI